jgi:hypothetical protein
VPLTDPNTLEDYLMLASDSRGTYKNGSVKDDDKKIFGDDNGNYCFANAGKYLQDYFSEQSIFNQFLNHPKNVNNAAVIATLNGINDVLENQEGQRNAYLMAMKGDSPELIYIHGVTPKFVGGYKACGSGSLFMPSLKTLREDEYGRVHMTKEGALDFMLKLLNEAASMDVFTGGYMDAAIITANSIKNINKYSIIENTKINPVPTFFSDIREVAPYTHPKFLDCD